MRNRAEYWNPQSLEYMFLAEAKRLWELELQKPRLTTVHAGLVLNLIYNINGLDKIGWTFTIQAVVMARDLHLFDLPTGVEGKKRAQVRTKKMQDAHNFTAWTIFSWQRYVHSQPPNRPKAGYGLLKS